LGSFVIFDDLTGYTPADKLIEQGADFESLLQAPPPNLPPGFIRSPSSRDLYLCHFMARAVNGPADLKLIDTGSR